MDAVFWGKYDKDNTPLVHFDPLQSFIVNNRKVGFRIHIVPSRRKRPRDQIPPRRLLDKKSEFNKEDSVLYQVSIGNELCVPIAGDEQTLGSPFANAISKDFSGYRGIAILNKYSPMSYVGKSKGIAVVSYPTKFVETLYNATRNYELLLPLKTTINEFSTNPKINLKTPLTFCNIGPSSGASLRQLHAQLYMVEEANGLLTFGFTQSFRQNKDDYQQCLICKMANSKVFNHGAEEEHQDSCGILDHLEQRLNQCSLVIWEDDNVRLTVPHAPIRALSMRILVKRHTAHLGELTIEELQSLGKALALAHESIAIGTPSSWKIPQDRTVAFRQTAKIGDEFHMFVDVMPSIPLGGAEVIDSISVTTLNPYYVGNKIQSLLKTE